jgi:hypothetical protein
MTGHRSLAVTGDANAGVPIGVRLSGLTLRPILVVGLGILEWQAS